MFVTNWISTTNIQKISEITNFFRHYFLSRTEVGFAQQMEWHEGQQGCYCPGRWRYGGHLLQQSREGKRKAWHCLLPEA